jgi:prepilin-type N-terminal cleavage/methylation domain-containing protein
MRRQRTNAFTLIESLVALAVAALGLVALLELQLVSINTADKAQGLHQAVLLAQGKIAEALSSGHAEIGLTAGLVPAQGDQFAWQMDVEEARLPQSVVAGRSSYGLSLNPGSLRQLTVEVSWLKGPGAKHVSLTTYLAENATRAVQVRNPSSR